METLAERWRWLGPASRVARPEGAGPFPVVLIFPGCGGMRSHLLRYEQAAVEAGWMAVTVESFKARGWTEAFTRRFVCHGFLLRGRERAGDVLAAVDAVAKTPDADRSRIVLAGWSHGGWSVMDIMTRPFRRRGEARLENPQDADLSGLRGLFLAYPYVGVVTSARWCDWKRTAPVFAMLPARDHLASVDLYRKTLARGRKAGAEIEEWTPDATHAFDEPGLTHPKITHDPAMSKEAFRRFAGFLKRVA